MSEGRVRRGRTFVLGVLGLALLAALPVVSSLLADDREPELAPAASGGTGAVAIPIEEPLQGRLAYVGLDPERPGYLRVWVWDLESGTVREGPQLPLEDEPRVGIGYALSAGGPGREWLVLLRYGPPKTVAFVVRDVDPSSEAVSLVRGDVALASDGLSVLALERRREPHPECRGPSYSIETVDLVTGTQTPAEVGTVPCGTAFGYALLHSTPVVGFARSDIRKVMSYVLGPGDPERLVGNVFPFAAAGENVFFANARSRAGTFVWPGSGAPRPILPGSKIVGQVIATSADGRYLALTGTVDGVSGLWIIDVSAGLVRIRNDQLPSIANTLGVAFAPDGTTFVVGWEGNLVASEAGIRTLPLPPDAPEPRGPVVWLP